MQTEAQKAARKRLPWTYNLKMDCRKIIEAIRYRIWFIRLQRRCGAKPEITLTFSGKMNLTL